MGRAAAPVPSRNASSRRTSASAISSACSVPPPPPKPGISTCGSSPGTTTLVLNARNPFSTTSRPSATTSSYDASFGVSVTSHARALVVPQCDQ